MVLVTIFSKISHKRNKNQNEAVFLIKLCITTEED